MSPQQVPVLDVSNLSLSYLHGNGLMQVLSDVSLSVTRGEVLGLVGESGCGKSSLALLLLAYRTPNARVLSGEVRFHGADLLAMDRNQLDRVRGSRISFVPQNPTTALNPGMRIGSQIAELLRPSAHSQSNHETRDKILQALESVKLPDPVVIANRYPHQLSGGQQQRVAIAMALVTRPDLVVLDEPTTGLDVTTQAQILDLLIELRSTLGTSMVYVTHDLGVLAQIADRVGVMYAGHIVELAPAHEVLHSPRHPYARGLVGSVPRLKSESPPKFSLPLRGSLRRAELPPGCPFTPRCDFADEICGQRPQPLVQIAEGHKVACHRWKSVAASVPEAGASPGTSSESRQSPMPRHAGDVVSLQGVSLSYGRSGAWPGAWSGRRAAAKIVSDVSLSIKQGEVFALVGESGSGKTTVARAICGLIAAQSGDITLEGHALAGAMSERARNDLRRIQYVFQNPDDSLNPRSRIRNTLMRPLNAFFKMTTAEKAKRIRSALEDVGLDPVYAGRYPSQLSGGERQRIALARALVARPDLLVADEITSALDVSVQANILKLLGELKANSALSMLFISHDLAVVGSIADRVGVLYGGRLVELGETDEVFDGPSHPYTRMLLDAIPRTNRLKSSTAGTAKVRSSGIGKAPETADKGCPFFAKCPRRILPKCADEFPPWRFHGSTHRILCHLTDSELIDRGVVPRVAGTPNELGTRA